MKKVRRSDGPTFGRRRAELGPDPTTIVLIVFLVFMLCLMSLSIWGSCGTDKTAVNFRNAVKDKFASVKFKFDHFANKEVVVVPPSTPFESEIKFEKIGNGAAIDKKAMKAYIGPYESDTVLHIYRTTDRYGNNIKCSSDSDCARVSGACIQTDQQDTQKYCANVSRKSVSELRASWGFIPPSFAFYPYGKVNTDYKYYNPGDLTDINNVVKKGNDICMRACSDTNCAAVQIGVPENCAMKKSDPTGENSKGNTHSCGSSSEASCTLFYKSVDDADEAYYNIYNQKIPSGRTDYLGEKYYLLGENPDLTPSPGVSPKNSPVKWCNASLAPPSTLAQDTIGASPYLTAVGATRECSCTGDSVCTDTNCCIYRPLLTTAGSEASNPYYNIPVNLALKKACPAMQTGGGRCGQYTDSNGNIKYRSCEGSLKFASDGSVTTWYPLINKCVDANGNYNEKGLGDKSNFTCYMQYLIDKADPKLDKDQPLINLQNCNCFYATRSCVLYGVQPSCYEAEQNDPIHVKRGCVGSPPILVTDYIGPDGITSCDDPSTIPLSDRCVNDTSNNLCTGFPYGCGPTSGGLYIRST